MSVHLLEDGGITNHAKVTYVYTSVFVERTEQENDVPVGEYRDHGKELQKASEVQGEAFQQLHLQHEEAIKVPRQLFNILNKLNKQSYSRQVLYFKCW